MRRKRQGKRKEGIKRRKEGRKEENKEQEWLNLFQSYYLYLPSR